MTHKNLTFKQWKDKLHTDCAKWKRLDVHFYTTPESPMHHDNRCTLCRILAKEKTKLNARHGQLRTASEDVILQELYDLEGLYEELTATSGS